MRTLFDSQTSPSALPPPVPRSARARSLGTGLGVGELAPGAGRRQQRSGPASWRRRAARELRDPEPAVCGVSPSSSHAAGAGWTATAGRKLTGNRFPSLALPLMESELGLGLKETEFRDNCPSWAGAGRGVRTQAGAVAVVGRTDRALQPQGLRRKAAKPFFHPAAEMRPGAPHPSPPALREGWPPFPVPPEKE